MDLNKLSKKELIALVEQYNYRQEFFENMQNKLNEFYYIFTFDKNKKKQLEYIGKEVENVLGLTEEEYKFKQNKNTIIEFFHPDDLKKNLDYIKQNPLTPENNEWIFTYRFYHQKKKTYVWIEEIMRAFFNEKRELIKIYGAARDISHIKNIEREQNFIINSINECIYKVKFNDDGTKEIVYISPSIKNLLGFTTKEFEEHGQNKTFIKYVHPDDLKKVQKVIKEKLFNPKTKSILLRERIKHKETGEYVWIEENVIPKYNNKGKLIETVTVMRDISEVVKKEKELETSKDKFKRLADATQEAVLVHENGKILEFNKAAVKMFGYSENELKKMYVFDLAHPDYVSVLKENVINDIQEPYEAVGIKKDGNFITGIVSSKNITYGDKKLRVTTVRDITKEKEQEQEILLSHKSYKDLFDNSPILLYIQDENGVFLDVNKTVTERYGYSKEEIIGKTPDFLAAEGKNDIKKIQFYLKDVWENNTKHHFEFWAKTKSGEFFPKQVISRKGTYFGRDVIVSAGFDITELKNAEQQIKERETLFRSLTENAPDIILLLNKEGKILYHNQLNDNNRNKILNSTVYDFLPEESQKIYKEALTKLFKTGLPQTIEFKGQSGNPNELRWYRTRMGAIKNENGEVDKAIIIATDIDEVVKTALELKTQKERLSDIIENINEGIYKVNILSDTQQKISYASNQFYRWFNVKEGDIIDSEKVKELLANYHPEDMVKILELHNKNQQSKSYSVTYRYKINDEYRWFEEKIFKKYNKEGKYIANFGIIRDITEKMLAQQHLKQSEQRYRNLVTKNLAGVFKTNLKTAEIIDCNNAFARIFGYKTRVELIGNTAINFYLSEEDRVNYLKELTKKKSLTNFKQKLRKKDGSFVWVLMNVYISEENNQHFVEGTLIDITDIVNYQEELNKSKQNYQTLIETSPYGVVIHNEGKIVYHNQKALDIFGFKKSIVNKSIFDFVPKKYHSVIVERYKETLQKGSSKPFDYEIEKDNGEKIILEVIPSLVYLQNKKMIYLAFRDVTEKQLYEKERIRAEVAEEANRILKSEIEHRKKIEKQLSEAKRFTQSIIDSSLDIIIAADEHERIIEFNKAAEQTFGYTKEEVLNKHVSFIYKNDELYATVKKQIDLNGQFSGEIINIRKDGSEFISYLSASLLYDEEGNIIGSMGVSRDISDIKEAERQLRISEEKYRDLFDNAIDIIQSVNDKGKFEYVNKSWLKTLEYTSKEIEKLQFLDIIHPKSKEHCINYFNQLINNKNVSNQVQMSFITKSGKEIVVEGNINVKRHKNGFSTRGIFHDITERIKAEEKIKKSLAEKEILLKEIHHRVKNNLQIISSILNLQSSYVTDKNTLEILTESQMRIKSMAYIHESLYQNENFAYINFSEYISNLSKNLLHSYQINNNLIELILNLDELTFNIDTSIPLGLIVNELITNALKYAYKPNQKGKLWVTLKLKNNIVTLKIKDNGVGLPENIDIYNTETLGLQLVVTLAEQIDANITLNTAKNKGTEFILKFKYK